MKGKKDKQGGFVSAFAAAALSGIILIMVFYSQTAFLSRQRHLTTYLEGESTARAFDSVAATVQKITGISYGFANSGSGSVNTTFKGSFPLLASGAMAKLPAFLSGDYSQDASAPMSLDISGFPKDGFSAYSAGGAYFFSDPAGGSAGFDIESGRSTLIFAVDFFFNSSEVVVSEDQWSSDPNPDTIVTVHVVHPGGRSDTVVNLDSSLPHIYTAYVRAGKSRYIRFAFGQATGSGSAYISSKNADGNWSISALFPYALAKKWYYNATLSVQKGQVNRTSMVTMYDS